MAIGGDLLNCRYPPIFLTSSFAFQYQIHVNN